jgi:gliding motility-associated-like protein
VQLGPFIYNSVPPPLPEISTNGIKGTWNPSAINTGSSGTTNYIFTPAITACAGTARMEIRTEIQAIISADGKIPGVDGIIVGSCGKVNLDASKSIGEALKYEWTLLDQGALLSGPSMISTEFRLSSSYTGNLPAAFRVGLLITDKAGNKDSEQITIHIDQPPVAGVYSSGKIEKDGSMIVDGTVSTGTKLSYKWTTAEGKIIGADNQPTAHFFGAGMYRLIITDIHGCQNVNDFKFPIELYEIFVNPDYVRISWAQDTTIKVLDNDRSTVRFINNSVRVIQQPRLGNTNVNSNGTITYSPTMKQPGHDAFVYEACDEVNLCDTAIVKIDIYESGITTPEGFSPNGDGVNDLFVFSGLQSYLNSTLYVYTRSGQLVYESHDYQNNWDGRTLKSTLSNLQLVPTGTYYYVLKLGVTNRVIKGFVFIAY